MLALCHVRAREDLRLLPRLGIVLQVREEAQLGLLLQVDELELAEVVEKQLLLLHETLGPVAVQVPVHLEFRVGRRILTGRKRTLGVLLQRILEGVHTEVALALGRLERRDQAVG